MCDHNAACAFLPCLFRRSSCASDVLPPPAKGLCTYHGVPYESSSLWPELWGYCFCTPQAGLPLGFVRLLMSLALPCSLSLAACSQLLAGQCPMPEAPALLCCAGLLQGRSRRCSASALTHAPQPSRQPAQTLEGERPGYAGKGQRQQRHSLPVYRALAVTLNTGRPGDPPADCFSVSRPLMAAAGAAACSAGACKQEGVSAMPHHALQHRQPMQPSAHNRI